MIRACLTLAAAATLSPTAAHAQDRCGLLTPGPDQGRPQLARIFPLPLPLAQVTLAAMKSSVKLLVLTGLALGAILGIAGTIVPSANLRSIFWAIDGVGLIVATALLALHFFRAQNELLAAGFLVYAIGESVMLAGTAATLQASVPSFAAGAALWSAALMLVSAPRGLALWNRIVGVIASGLFAATALQVFGGNALTPLSRPLPSFAYPFLVLNFIGWGIVVSRSRATTAAPQTSAAFS